MTCSKSNSGFVALVSVVVVSAVLLVVMFTLSTSSFFNRFDALDSENKSISLGLAEACMSAAMLKVAQDPAYAPAIDGDCVSVGGTCYSADPQKVCAICSIVIGNPEVVVTRAVYNGAYTTLRAYFDTTPDSFVVTKWEELSGGFPSCTVP
jgi:hypothetical protein